MDYTHGTPARGLRINATDMKGYDLYVRGYAAAEHSGGSIVVKIDTTNDWTLATAAGKLVDPETAPAEGLVRFVNKVEIEHSWEKKPPAPKDKPAPPPVPMKDTHTYYFDVTPALPKLYQAKLERGAGITR